MSTNTTGPTLVLDYDLMENYVLATSLGAFTSAAAVTNQSGLAEAFVIGGANLDTVNHICQSSANNWAYYSLPDVPDGNTITAIAAAVGSEGRRIVAVATDGPNVYVTYENTPYLMNWIPWVAVAQQLNVSQLVLRIYDETFQLAALVPSGVYGDIVRWQVYSAPLNCQVGSNPAATWGGAQTPAASFYTDLCVCDFAQPGNQDPVLVTGCVSPTLSLFPVSTFSEWIWSTAGNGRYANLVSIYCPLPSDPTAVVISPLVVSGTGCETQYPAQTTQPPSVLCAGSIEDLSSSGPPLLTLAIGGASQTWSSKGTGTTLAGAALYEPTPPNQPPEYQGWYTLSSAQGSYSGATCWFMYPDRNLQWYGNNPSSGIIQFDQNTQINFGLIRNDLLSPNAALMGGTVFTTRNQPGPASEKLTIFSFNSTFPNHNCYIVNTEFDNPDQAPTTAPFPAATVRRLPGVLVFYPILNNQVGCVTCQGAPAGGFSNWCQIMKQDGSACVFAVDSTYGDLWFAVVAPGGSSTWSNLMSSFTTVPTNGFLPCSPSGITLAGMQASDGTMHVFAVGADAMIYHISETATPNTFNGAVLSAPAGIGSIALVPAPPKTISPSFFAISNSTPAVLYYGSIENGIYSYSQILLETQGAQQLEQVTAYTVDAHLLDPSGALMPGQQVTITSTQPCTAVVNGTAALLAVGANSFPTNTSGGLHLIIPTTDISAPTLTFNLAGEPLEVQIVGGGIVPQVSLNSKVLQRLATKISDDFANAVDFNGNPLFQSGAVGNVSTAVHNLLQNAQQATGASSSNALAAGPSPRKSIDRSSRDIGVRLPGGAVGAESLPQGSTSAATSWICGEWDDFKKWVISCFNSASQKTQSVAAEVTSSQQTTGLLIQISLTVDNVTSQFQCLVEWDDPNLNNSVLGLATLMMKRAGAAAAQVAQWLSERFDWGQVQYAQQVVSNAITACFSLLQQSATDIQTKFDAAYTSGVFTTSPNDLSNALSSMTSQSLSGLANVATLPTARCNLFSAHLMDFCGSPLVSKQTMTLTAGLAGVYDSVVNNWGPGVQSNVAVQTQVSAMQSAMQNNPAYTDQILQQEVTALSSSTSTLGNVVTSAGLISLVQDAVDGVLELASTDVATLYGLLNTNVYIPWVSELYQLRFGGSVSTPSDPKTPILGILSAAIAIPAVTAFEYVTGTPFPNGQSDVNAFTAEFTAGNLSAIWGLAQPGWQQQVNDTNILQNAASLLALGGLSTRLYVDQILDAIAAGQLTMENLGSFVLSTADISSSLALFASSACTLVANMVKNTSYAPDAAEMAAVAVTGAHWVIDTLFTCMPTVQETLRLDGDTGICMDMALSTASASLFALADGLVYGTTWQSNNPPYALASDVMAVFAAIGHIGLLTDLAENGGVAPALLLDYTSDQCGLWATVQTMPQSSAVAGASSALLEKRHYTLRRSAARQSC